ncbi:MAG: hypothetical protein ACE5D8_09370 [Fidelibacterota bacterium]
MPNGDFYSRIATLYDRLLNPFISSLRQSVADWVASEHPDALLDMCSGTGDQLAILPPSVNAWGIDLSPAMIAQAEMGN